MAITPLSLETNLALFESVIQANTGTLAVQKSGILVDEIDEIIHYAVVFVRNLAKKALNPQYVTIDTVVPAANLIDLSTKAINDLSHASMQLYDTAYGEIEILPESLWHDVLTLYSAVSLNTACFARVGTMLIGATDNNIAIQIYRGASLLAYGTVTLTYSRDPVKATAAATKIDLPDAMMPIAQDVATLRLMRRLTMTPPKDMEQRVIAFVNSQMGPKSVGG